MRIMKAPWPLQLATVQRRVSAPLRQQLTHALRILVQELPSYAVDNGPGRCVSFKYGPQAQLGSSLLAQGIAAAYALRQQVLSSTGSSAAAMTGNPRNSSSSSQQLPDVLEGWKLRCGQGAGIWKGRPSPSRSQLQQSTDTDQGGSQAHLQGQPLWLCALKVPMASTFSSR